MLYVAVFVSFIQLIKNIYQREYRFRRDKIVSLFIFSWHFRKGYGHFFILETKTTYTNKNFNISVRREDPVLFMLESSANQIPSYLLSLKPLNIYTMSVSSIFQ